MSLPWLVRVAYAEPASKLDECMRSTTGQSQIFPAPQNAKTDYTNSTAFSFWSIERSYFGICVRPNYRGCPYSALETGSAGEIPHPISKFNLSPDPPTRRGSTDYVTALPRKNGHTPGLTFLRFTEAWVPSRLGRNSRCGTLVTSYP